MKTLPLLASDDQIKALVVEWTALLALGHHQEAVDLFWPSEGDSRWTGELMRKTIAGYGVPDLDKETLAMMLEEWGVERFEIASLHDREDKDEIIAASIQVDRDDYLGLEPYVGTVHYWDVVLTGGTSDLTARFHIRRVGHKELALEFLDLHML